MRNVKVFSVYYETGKLAAQIPWEAKDLLGSSQTSAGAGSKSRSMGWGKSRSVGHCDTTEKGTFAFTIKGAGVRPLPSNPSSPHLMRSTDRL